MMHTTSISNWADCCKNEMMLLLTGLYWYDYFLGNTSWFGKIDYWTVLNKLSQRLVWVMNSSLRLKIFVVLNVQLSRFGQ